MKETMTASAFAKLCGTTKATLRWYRKIGLLEPDAIGSNGYAYYAVEQVVEFSIIQALQNTGYSLEQIKSLNQHEDTNDTKFLDEKIEQLEQHIEELKKQREFLKRIRDTQHKQFEQWGIPLSEGDWQIRYQEKEYYLVMQAPTVDSSVYQQRLSAFQQICAELGIDDSIIMFIDQEGLHSHEFAERFFTGTKINDHLAIQEKLTQLHTELSDEVSIVVRDAGNYFAYLTSFPLELEENYDVYNAPLSNPMIDGQNAALTLALHNGGTLEMGLLETPLTVLRQEDGRKYLFLEITILCQVKTKKLV